MGATACREGCETSQWKEAGAHRQEGALMPPTAPALRVASAGGRVRRFALYDSNVPLNRRAAVYMVKTLPDGTRLAFNRDYRLLGAVRASAAEWDAALVHSLDTCAEYSVNDNMPGDAIWFEVCGLSREAYRRSWIEQRGWDEERHG